MRMLFCTCNITVLKRVQLMCEELHIKTYQVIDRVHAKNREGAHRFNDEIWPGYNAIVLFQFRDDAACHRLADAFEAYNQRTTNVTERLVVCSWEVDRYFF